MYQQLTSLCKFLFEYCSFYISFWICYSVSLNLQPQFKIFVYDCSLLLSSAINNKAKEKVAIKKLHRPFQSEIFAKRAYRELRLLKHMKHENVSVFYAWRALRSDLVAYIVSSIFQQFQWLEWLLKGTKRLVSHHTHCVFIENDVSIKCLAWRTQCVSSEHDTWGAWRHANDWLRCHKL